MLEFPIFIFKLTNAPFSNSKLDPKRLTERYWLEYHIFALYEYI